MSFSSEVRAAVLEFAAAKKQFTSVDIANEVKKTGKWIRNREVAAELRNLFTTGDTAFDGYDSGRIPVDSGSKTATLYLPCGSDPQDYKDRDQKALGPTARPNFPHLQQGHTAPSAPAPQATRATPAKSVGKGIIKRVPRKSMKTQAAGKVDVADVLSTDIIMSKVITTKERIKIPGPMIRKLGWVPGQPVDLSRIKTHNELPVGVVVAKDYRVSIPRAAVNWGHGPVKVILTSKNDIIFDKP
jgi:hypothetical protein